MKNILILGSGFIGSELTYRFSKDFKITCIDHGKNFSTLSNYCTNVNFVKGDINDSDLVQEFAKEMDLIIYCINTGGVIDCIKNPEKFEKINIFDFEKLLKKLKNFKGRFLLFSTAFIYSDVPKIDETAKPIPETYYGQLRIKQEILLKNSGLSYLILRLSNIFGHSNFKNFNHYGAIEKFIEQAFSIHIINLHGDGSQKVDYLFIDDLVDFLINFFNADFKKNIMLNISTGKSYSIFAIAEIIQNIIQKKFSFSIKISKANPKIKLPNSPIMNISKVYEDFSWKPKAKLEKEIEKMMDVYYLQHKG
jgi:nucleoside-diphosphate-sugar epimerase